MNHRPLVFIDVETTGGNPDRARVIDIGAIRVENGKVVDTLNQLINPGVPIPHFITNLTGITNDMIWESPSFETVAPRLEELLNGAVFVAHHVDFDYSFIRSEFKNIGVEYTSDRACTVKLSRLTHPNMRRHGLDKIIGQMELDVANRHRGYDDAEVLWKYFQDQMNTKTDETFRNLAKVTIRTRKMKSFNSNQLELPLNCQYDIAHNTSV